MIQAAHPWGKRAIGVGPWGGTSTTNRVAYRDLLNIKRVAYYLPEPD